MAESSYKQTALERTKELTDRLEAGIQELLQSDKYMEYLKSMSQFYGYSTRNTLLIHMQNPHATRVASFKLWDEKFNRHVKKGEKGIRIFAPIMTKEKREFEKIDPETKAPLLDKNGNIVTEELESETLRFKPVPVFDVSQTYGDPLPELVENLTGDVAQYEAFLDALRKTSTLPIAFEPLRDSNDGYCRYGDKIGIREGMSEVQTISAVVHEITHAKLHDKEKTPETAVNKSKSMKEVEAESISYVVCQHYGIETSPNSFGYLAEWGSRDMSEFKASLDTIRKEAGVLITDIDEHFGAICKERGIDLTAKAPDPHDITNPVTKQPAEPSFATEEHTEHIAGVAFTATDIILEAPEEIYDITYWQLGTGINVLHYFNESDERYGNYETLARISPDRSVEFVMTDLPDEIKDKINNYALTADIPNIATDVVKDEAPKETRPIGDVVLMPLVFNSDGNLERTEKRTKVKIEPSIGKYSVYSREINGLNDPYYYLLTDSGKLVSIYGAGRYGGQMPDTVTEQTIDAYFSQAKEMCHNALQDPEKWVDFNNAAIANRLEEADKHNQPIRESREAARAESAQKRQAEENAKKAQTLQNYNTRIDDMAQGLVNGDRIDTTLDRDMDKNPLFTLFDRYGVDLPLATKGWVNRNLKSMQMQNNGDCTMWLPKGIKPSHTFVDAMKILKDKIINITQTAEMPNMGAETKEPTEIMPDTTITVSERNSYGYTADELLPLHREKALELFDGDHAIYMLYDDNTEAMAFDRDEIISFAEMNSGIFGIERGDWERTLEYAELKARYTDNTKESEVVHSNDIDTFAIYQLKEGDELHYHRFASMKQLEKDNLAVDRDNYNLVYTAPLLQGETLDDIYRQFNLAHPKGFTGHSLSISDVIVIQCDGEITSHYVDSFGFAELPAFLGNEKQKEQSQIIESHNEVDEKSMPEPNSIEKSVYRQSIPYARDHDELDRYKADIHLNIECRNAIDIAINESRYDTHSYKMKDAVKQVIDVYGTERVELIMAKIVQSADWDGRYSHQNKAWAKGFEIPQSMKDIYSNTHPCLLDGFLNKVREKPSLLQTLKANTQKSRQPSDPKPDTKKSKEMEM